MIVINATVEADPDSIAAMSGAIARMEAASRAEAGCHDYCFSVELNDATRLRITERWESMEALVAHFRTPHMAEFQKAMADHPPRSTTLRCYEAREVDLPSP